MCSEAGFGLQRKSVVAWMDVTGCDWLWLVALQVKRKQLRQEMRKDQSANSAPSSVTETKKGK